MRVESTKSFGQAIKSARRRQRMTQRDLALISGTGERFIVDLEAGKATSQLGRALAVAAAVGLIVSIDDPQATNDEPAA